MAWLQKYTGGTNFVFSKNLAANQINYDVSSFILMEIIYIKTQELFTWIFIMKSFGNLMNTRHMINVHMFHFTAF